MGNDKQKFLDSTSAAFADQESKMTTICIEGKKELQQQRQSMTILFEGTTADMDTVKENMYYLTDGNIGRGKGEGACKSDLLHKQAMADTFDNDPMK